jgi:CPA2 family monovalent cation:H+ antiporter-2
MPHETALIATIAAGLGLAFLFGLLAQRFRLPPILGYLLAGVAVGPFTPGFVADAGLASQLSELGVILLMFGVGLHFSIADLMAVRRIAIPGALVQTALATVLGAVVARLWGWSWGSGIVLGLALSVASTVVLLRALESRGILDSADGRIAVGWLIVEDIITVLALVLLPPLAPLLGAAGAGETSLGGLLMTIALTLLKVVAFVAVMLLVGRRVVPWLLGRVVRTGSRELFTLAVLSIALGIAVGAASLFGVSFALGAFFAGVIVSESEFSHEAATNALPLRDAFAVLFFVSVGMLFDPAIVLRQPWQLVGVLLIVLVGKSVASMLIVLLFRYSVRTALTISASLAQIGEFSFILAALAVSLGLMDASAQGLIVAVALLSITLNPFVFGSLEPVEAWIRKRPRLAAALERPAGEVAQLPAAIDESRMRDHVVLIGFGRVGAPIAEELSVHGVPHVVVDQSRERAEHLRARGLPVIYGDATRAEVLSLARVEDARLVVVAAPDAFQTRAILALARRLNPDVTIIARTHGDEEREFLEAHGAQAALVGERELAVSLTRRALRSYGIMPDMEAVAARTLRTPAEGLRATH